MEAFDAVLPRFWSSGIRSFPWPPGEDVGFITAGSIFCDVDERR